MSDLPEADLQPLQPTRDPGSDSLAWRRLRAGLLVELGLAPRAAARRWQKEVAAGRFDADACAEEILAGAVLTSDAEAKLAGRAARLQRDLLMAPALRGARGAARRAREGARGLVAMLVAQVVTLTVLLAIVLVGLLVARLTTGFSFDGFFDSIGSLFGS